MTNQNGLNPNFQTIIDEFFFSASASSRVEGLSFLLNAFVESDYFKNMEAIEQANTVFSATELMTFMVKLQELKSKEGEPEVILKAA